MKALVLGGGGFIGQYLVRELIVAGHEVVVVDLRDEGMNHLARSLGTYDGPDSVGITNDVRTLATSVFNSVHRSFDVVYHLAAKVGVQTAIREGLDVLRWNMETTAAALKLAPGAVFIYASSSEVYGDNPDQPLNEDKPLILPPPTDARWAYTYGKALDEMTVLHTRPGSIIVRPFNTVGVGQNEAYGAVLPSFVRAAVEGRPIEVHGGTQTRSFVHVADVVTALRLLGEMALAGGLKHRIYDIGTDDEISMIDLARYIARLVNPDAQRVDVRSGAKAERGCMRRATQALRLRADTGWMPQHTGTAVGELIEAYKAGRT